MPGVTRITAGLPLPRCQTPPASTNAASRSRELNTGDGARSSTFPTARVLPPMAATVTRSGSMSRIWMAAVSTSPLGTT